ncbi:MAG TPA: hypothetical protein VF812_09250 [Ktedonobacterales bacterium]
MAERLCLRCGAPYDEGATVCFTCGASIGELETPTQPVRAPKRPTAQAPAPVAEEAQAPVATATPAAVPASRLLTVGSSYRAATPAVAPRPARRWLWPALVGALVLIAALSVGGYFTARALLASKPVPTTTTFHDAQGHFSFTEPALWTVTPRADGALLADSNGANTVTITVASAQTGQTALAVADAQAKQQGLQAAPEMSIAGDQWEQRAGQVTGVDGATRVVTLYVDIHAGELYTIETSSPTSVSDSINTLVYQPLLASFTFH